VGRRRAAAAPRRRSSTPANAFPSSLHTNIVAIACSLPRYHSQVDQAYALLDSLALGGGGAPGAPGEAPSASASLHDHLAAAAALREAQALLGVAAADPGAALARCQEELAALRVLWEAAAGAAGARAAWGAAPWAGCDADALVEETKKMVKQLRALPRSLREYEAYRAVEGRVKGMGQALPLLADLAHPAVRDRHWAALAAVSARAAGGAGRCVLPALHT
jgi:dynein heavy chain